MATKAELEQRVDELERELSRVHGRKEDAEKRIRALKRVTRHYRDTCLMLDMYLRGVLDQATPLVKVESCELPQSQVHNKYSQRPAVSDPYIEAKDINFSTGQRFNERVQWEDF